MVELDEREPMTEWEEALARKGIEDDMVEDARRFDRRYEF